MQFNNILKSCGLTSTVQREQLNHKIKCKFISKVLNEVPFLYKSPEIENFLWRKIASELAKDEILDRFAHGYNLSLEKNSFGSVINHLKLTFYQLMMENDKSGNNTLVYPSEGTNFNHLEDTPMRCSSASKTYEYFLPEEIRTMITSAITDQTTSKCKNFFRTILTCEEIEPVNKDSILEKKFGVMYSMDENNYRTTYLKIKITEHKYKFLRMIAKLHLLAIAIPLYENGDIESSISMSLVTLVLKQSNVSIEGDKTDLVEKLNKQIEYLKEVKHFSQELIDKRLGAVDHLDTEPIILEVHLQLY